ncbi:MAG TPA: hypothetical protein VF525_00360 [Pyrinomonadaceae bacterium]|jgi:hypothetical protein
MTTTTTTPQEHTPPVCERCDRESQYLIKQLAADNSVHYVCWDCLRREEKRINVSSRFKRGRRG